MQTTSSTERYKTKKIESNDKKAYRNNELNIEEVYKNLLLEVINGYYSKLIIESD